jgi:hypothetical protein
MGSGGDAHRSRLGKTVLGAAERQGRGEAEQSRAAGVVEVIDVVDRDAGSVKMLLQRWWRPPPPCPPPSFSPLLICGGGGRGRHQGG